MVDLSIILSGRIIFEFMNLHVIAYPEFAPADFQKIQLFRKDYNSLYNIIASHFTIVFSIPDIPGSDFISEVKKQVDEVSIINFNLRCAVINKDSFSNNYDAFLVPDEGFGRITKLHDKLYSDKFSVHHRLDISYIPHISIANSSDAKKIKNIVDEWNKDDFEIKGTIASLDVINYENRVITTIEKINLK